MSFARARAKRLEPGPRNAGLTVTRPCATLAPSSVQRGFSGSYCASAPAAVSTCGSSGLADSSAVHIFGATREPCGFSALRQNGKLVRRCVEEASFQIRDLPGIDRQEREAGVELLPCSIPRSLPPAIGEAHLPSADNPRVCSMIAGTSEMLAVFKLSDEC